LYGVWYVKTMYRILFHPTVFRQLLIGVLTVEAKALQDKKVVAGGLIAHRFSDGIARFAA
jgi:hypothetical protein